MIPTLPELLDAAADRFADRPLTLDWRRSAQDGAAQCYGDFAQQVNALAAGLWEFGVRRGTSVAALLPNSPGLLRLWLAVTRIGGVFVPLNPSLTDVELESVLRHAEARIVVTERRNGPWTRGRDLITPVDQLGYTSLPQLVESTSSSPPIGKVDAGDPATVLYTVVSTGQPRGCVLSHASYTLPGAAFAERLGLCGDDRLLGCLPLFRMSGQSFAISGITAGASIGFVDALSTYGFWDQIVTAGATVLKHRGAMLTLILRNALGGQRPVRHSLRLVYGSGIRPDVAMGFSQRFGVTVVQGFDRVETNTLLCSASMDPFPGSIGRPLPYAELRIADELGRSVPTGVIGEIQVRRNPALMLGYLHDLRGTMAAMTGEWFRTGQMGWVDDDGWYYLASRPKDLVPDRAEVMEPGMPVGAPGRTAGEASAVPAGGVRPLVIRAGHPDTTIM